MRIIYIDIDGVLRPESDYSYKHRGISEVSKECVAVFNRLFHIHSDIHLVLSSTWRLYDNTPTMNGLTAIDRLKEQGLDGDFLGVTESINNGSRGDDRGYECAKWLEDHKDLDIENFVILDNDTSIFFDYTLDKYDIDRDKHLHFCDSIAGFTERDLMRVTHMLI